MVAPKVVVFDLGKVLLDFDYHIAARGLAEQSRVSPLEIQEFINHSPLLVQYEKGQMTRVEFFEAVRRLSGFQGSIGDFSALFSEVFTPIEPMIVLKERLTAAGIPTYIFSNTNDMAIHHIQATYPFYRRFDGYILSYQHGFMKPEVELYEALEALTRCAASQICYLDDREENVAAGNRRGWRSLVHVAPPTSVEWLRNLGLPVGGLAD